MFGVPVSFETQWDEDPALSVFIVRDLMDGVERITPGGGHKGITIDDVLRACTLLCSFHILLYLSSVECEINMEKYICCVVGSSLMAVLIKHNDVEGPDRG